MYQPLPAPIHTLLEDEALCLGDAGPPEEAVPSDSEVQVRYQPCPVCNWVMRAVAGRKDAICHGCGYKEPCC